MTWVLPFYLSASSVHFQRSPNALDTCVPDHFMRSPLPRAPFLLSDVDSHVCFSRHKPQHLREAAFVSLPASPSCPCDRILDWSLFLGLSPLGDRDSDSSIPALPGLAWYQAQDGCSVVGGCTEKWQPVLTWGLLEHTAPLGMRSPLKLYSPLKSSEALGPRAMFHFPAEMGPSQSLSWSICLTQVCQLSLLPEACSPHWDIIHHMYQPCWEFNWDVWTIGTCVCWGRI